MKTLNKRNKGKVSRELIKTIILAKRTKEKVDLYMVNLKRADLRGVNLEGANLRGAYLKRADLRGVNLKRADLRGAYLEGADLIGVNLEGADLRGAYLERADLIGVNLEGADLRGVYLEGADLRGADLRGAYNLYVFNAFDTSKRMVYCVKHSDTWYIKAGCFWGTIAELKAKVLATHNSKVYLHNIALLEQL